MEETMTKEEKREAAKEWINSIIQAYNDVAKEFNPDRKRRYIECPRCIETHPSSKEIHCIHIKEIAELLELPRSYMKVVVAAKGYDKTFFKYRGYTFFELEEVD